MKKYDAYKDSGVDWIGDVPEHWEVKRLRYVISGKLMYGANETAEQENIEHPRYIRITDFGNDGKLKEDTFKSLPPEKANEYLLSEGDILFARSGATVGKTFQFRNFEGTACFAGYLIKATPNIDIILSDFLYYYTNSAAYENWKNSIFNQATIQNIGADKYALLEIPLPIDIEEQTIIATYLDSKTAEIDALIADKKRLIELLEEEKIAFINQVVTKGLDPDAPMKDSGVEWLGEVPEGWIVKRLKYLVSKIGSGITPTGGSAVYQTQGIPFLRSQNIHFDGLKLDDVAYISEEIDQLMSNSRILENDVLLNITGASIGRCFYVPKEFGRGNVNQHVCIIRPMQEKIKTIYLYLLLRSSLGQTQIDLLQSGANREGLNFEQLKNFIFPMPQNVNEQILIAHYIEAETTRIETRKAEVQQLIDLLNEYRTALISEVVTGKIKVTE